MKFEFHLYTYCLPGFFLIQLQIQFVRLRSNIRLNTVNIEVANMDIDRIELKYREIWNDFLYNNNSNNHENISNEIDND